MDLLRWTREYMSDGSGGRNILWSMGACLLDLHGWTQTCHRYGTQRDPGAQRVALQQRTYLCKTQKANHKEQLLWERLIEANAWVRMYKGLTESMGPATM